MRPHEHHKKGIPPHAKMSQQTDEKSRHSRATNGLHLPLISEGFGPYLAEDKSSFLKSQKKIFTQDKKKRDIVSSSNEWVTFSGAKNSLRPTAMEAADLLLNQEVTQDHIVFGHSEIEDEIPVEEVRRMRQKLAMNNILANETADFFTADRSQNPSRETTFLAGVDFTRQQETEKDFKVSEEFPGCLPLTEDEFQDILYERNFLVAQKNKIDWSNAHRRQRTSLISPSQSQAAFGVEQSVLLQAIRTLTPSFNQNRNDIWSKRINTLRFFILAVTRWIIRRRAGIRLNAIQRQLLLAIGEVKKTSNSFYTPSFIQDMDAFSDGVLLSMPSIHEASNTGALLLANRKELVQKWVEDDNSSNLTTGPSTIHSIINNALSRRDSSDPDLDQCSSVLKSTLTVGNGSAAARSASFTSTRGQCEMIQKEEILNRTFFPTCTIEECDTLQALKVSNTEAVVEFDDRTFFHLKVRSGHTDRHYAPHKIPDLPLFFAPHPNIMIRTGAIEEHIIQCPAG